MNDNDRPHSPVKASTGPLGLFRSAQFVAQPGAKIRGHSHDDLHILLVMKGALEEATGSTSVHMRPGTIRVSPASTRHRIDFADAETECFVVHITSLALAGRFGLANTTGSRFSADARLALDLQRLAASSRHPEDQFVAELELLQTLARLQDGDENRSDPPAWLRDIEHRLRSDDEPLTVTQAAAEAGADERSEFSWAC